MTKTCLEFTKEIFNGFGFSAFEFRICLGFRNWKLGFSKLPILSTLFMKQGTGVYEFFPVLASKYGHT